MMKLRLTLCGTAITCAVLVAPLAANASFGPQATPGADPEPAGQISAENPATFELARGGNSGRGNGNHGGGNNGGNHGGGNNGGNNGGGNNGGANNGGANNGGGNGNESGSGRRKPRIPGGSGCDDAGDLLEHPECSP